MMLTVLIKTESHYTINRKRVRKLIEDILKKKGVRGNIEVSVSIVGDRLMKKLNKQYRHVDETTTILSFPLCNSGSTTPFIDPPDNILRLGDIVISYPGARSEAAEEGKLMDDKIDELITHGMTSLLGNQQ